MPDPATGPRRRYDQAPERARLHPTTPGELETTSATRPPRSPRQGKARVRKPRRASFNHYPGQDDRALKASPTGGLRPALTALPLLAPAKSQTVAPTNIHQPAPQPRNTRPIELLYEERSVDKTRCFRYDIGPVHRGVPRQAVRAPLTAKRFASHGRPVAEHPGARRAPLRSVLAVAAWLEVCKREIGERQPQPGPVRSIR